MTDMPEGYYNRFNEGDNYDDHLFRAGKVLQSAEMNEVQASIKARMRGITDTLFKDGGIVRDCAIVVNAGTGYTTCQSGAVYLRGAVRGVPAATLTIPVNSTVAVGIRLVDSVVDDTDDPDLRDPAVGFRNQGKAGAYRLKVDPVWGWDGDGEDGDFYPIYTVDNGVLRAKVAPPAIDAISQAISGYDRDSTGGAYVVSGLETTMLDDSAGNQVYSISEGRARVRGINIDLRTSTRLSVAPVPEQRFIDSEPHLSSTIGSQRVNLNLYPVANITQVRITKRKVVTLTHGVVVGSQDTLPDPAVVQIVAVNQGGTENGGLTAFTGGVNYTATTDYLLTSGKVDWTPGGAEIATGSTYKVIYDYIEAVTPTAIDASGFTVTGAVSGTLILTSYNQYLPRIDRICVSDDGEIVLLKGTSAFANPKPPLVPDNLLPIATVNQTWDASRTVVGDGVRVVPMKDLAGFGQSIDFIMALIAQQRLESSVSLRESGALKGIFVDPFIDDSQRDNGITQTAAVYDGCLTLQMDAASAYVDNRGGASSALTTTTVASISQLARTTSVKVNSNPNAFSAIKPTLTLNPSADRWPDRRTTTKTRVASGTADEITGGGMKIIRGYWTGGEPGDPNYDGDGGVFVYDWAPYDKGELITSTSIKSINVQFTSSGWNVGETLTSIKFDKLSATIVGGPVVANGSGVMSGTFTIPTNVPIGTKSVTLTGSSGRTAESSYDARSTSQVKQAEGTAGGTSPTATGNLVEPKGQTFVVDEAQQIASWDIWFDAKGTSPVELQIRSMYGSDPSTSVLASARVLPANIVTNGGPTNFAFASPLSLAPNVEYAFVLLCDDADASVNVAVLGQQDSSTQKWVTEQPYQVGMMLTSSDGQTWTKLVDRDITFRANRTIFATTTRTVSLGTIAVTGATDLLIAADIETPSSATTCLFRMTFPDASTRIVAAGQPVRLDTAITGNVGLEAILTGTAKETPVLLPNVQVIWGACATSGTYVHRALVGGTSVTTKVIVEVYLPGASSVAVAVKGTDDVSWTTLSSPTSIVMRDGWVELTYTSGSMTKDLIHSRLTLTGSTSARPKVRALRVLTK